MPYCRYRIRRWFDWRLNRFVHRRKCKNKITLLTAKVTAIGKVWIYRLLFVCVCVRLFLYGYGFLRHICGVLFLPPFVCLSVKNLPVDYREIWTMGWPWITEMMVTFCNLPGTYSGYFVLFMDSPVVDWCEKWKRGWKNNYFRRSAGNLQEYALYRVPASYASALKRVLKSMFGIVSFQFRTKVTLIRPAVDAVTSLQRREYRFASKSRLPRMARHRQHAVLPPTARQGVGVTSRQLIVPAAAVASS